MKTKIDELGGKLHTRLDYGLEQLKVMKNHLEKAPKEAEEAVTTRLDAAKRVLKEKKKECDVARGRLNELIQDKKSETRDAIADWKATVNHKKLEKRAQRAKKLAETRIEIALYAFLEAEEAILEAISARKDTESTGE
jgi:hypothetical protein